MTNHINWITNCKDWKNIKSIGYEKKTIESINNDKRTIEERVFIKDDNTTLEKTELEI